MKPKLLSWNVRWLNEGRGSEICLDSRRQILFVYRNLSWSSISSSVVHSLWECQHVDWCFSAFRGASSGILLICDKGCVEDRRVFGGVCCCLILFDIEMSKMVSLQLLWAFMGLLLIMREGIYGRNWLACLVGGIYRGALGETSFSLVFLLKD